MPIYQNNGTKIELFGSTTRRSKSLWSSPDSQRRASGQNCSTEWFSARFPETDKETKNIKKKIDWKDYG